MLNSLLATMLICMGVANTTPISNYDKERTNLVLNTPKKAITTNYDLELQQTNSTSYEQQNVEFNNGYTQETGTIRNSKTNIAGNNMAVNVIGNKYVQFPITTNVYFGNYLLDAVSSISDTYYKNVDQITRVGYILQINPYNINVETQITTTIHVTLTGITPTYTISGVKVKVDKYEATDNGFQNYIGMQVANKQPTYIQQEIEDINNGFYYQKETRYIDVSDFQNYTDTDVAIDTEITLSPNIANYVYIMLTPLLIVDNSTTYTATYFPASTTMQTSQPIHISGTNIVPEGTYEVIDIPNLMFEILGMPFAFVSQAFNLTLFPGTPYQINIANLFLSIFAILVFTWIITIIIKSKSG